MAKEIVGTIKLQIAAGQANPAPPVGPALGQKGVNIMAFCKEFNAATQKQAGDILPVVITVYKDKSFTFITKSPPASVLIKKAAGIAAGSKEPNKTKVGKLTKKQLLDIAKTKMNDLNARDDEAAMKIIAGTARQMGVDISAKENVQRDARERGAQPQESLRVRSHCKTPWQKTEANVTRRPRRPSIPRGSIRWPKPSRFSRACPRPNTT